MTRTPDSSGQVPDNQPEQAEIRNSEQALLTEHSGLNVKWRDLTDEVERVLYEAAQHPEHASRYHQRLEQLHQEVGEILQRQWEIEREIISR